MGGSQKPLSKRRDVLGDLDKTRFLEHFACICILSVTFFITAKPCFLCRRKNKEKAIPVPLHVLSRGHQHEQNMEDAACKLFSTEIIGM